MKWKRAQFVIITSRSEVKRQIKSRKAKGLSLVSPYVEFIQRETLIDKQSRESLP